MKMNELTNFHFDGALLPAIFTKIIASLSPHFLPAIILDHVLEHSLDYDKPIGGSATYHRYNINIELPASHSHLPSPSTTTIHRSTTTK